MRGKPVAKSVDAYLIAAPQEAQTKLSQLRRIVKAAAPKASEGISYGMPYYKSDGALVGFAAFKSHIGFFPGAIVRDFKKDLKGYETAKGTVRFSLEKPLPVALIKKLIKASLKRNKDRAAAKRRGGG
jgi:uncharacterized protein YdhG (YjbR/CyaY superfamily)